MDERHAFIHEIFGRIEAWLIESLPQTHETYHALAKLDELRRHILEDALHSQMRDYSCLSPREKRLQKIRLDLGNPPNMILSTADDK